MLPTPLSRILFSKCISYNLTIFIYLLFVYNAIYTVKNDLVKIFASCLKAH